jgi:serine/threonine protein kinase
MYVSITFFDEPATTHALKIVKKISNGKFKVYQARSPSQRTDYAVKTFPKNAFGTAQYNKEIILADLSHPNIIKHIPASIGFENDAHFHSIVTEFAKYGDIFDMVVGGVFNSEILVRNYFHQLVAGIEYLHSQGVAHLDLKLENLMIGSGFTLKIIDFDLAQNTKDKIITSAGTEGYRAPEVIDGSCTNFQAADIFSLGIILYALKAKSAPFLEVKTSGADGKDHVSLKYYSAFTRNNQAFWEMKAGQLQDTKFFSEDFKELINGMLEFNPSKRFTLEDVKNSKWFKGPILSQDKLRAEMRSRWEILQSQ